LALSFAPAYFLQTIRTSAHLVFDRATVVPKRGANVVVSTKPGADAAIAEFRGGLLEFA
jgi:hypothetical protein